MREFRVVAFFGVTLCIFVAASTSSPARTDRAVLRPGQLAVSSLAVDPNAPRTIYAATDVGVFRSTDGGANWKRTAHHRRTFRVAAAGRVVYAVGFDRAIHRVFRSTDGGAHWRMAAAKLPEALAFVVHPTNPTIVYASGWSGFFVTRDGAETWTRIDIPSTVTYKGAYDIAIDPNDPKTLFAADTGGGFHKSVDGGSSWTTLRSPSFGPDAVAVDRTTGVIYVASPPSDDGSVPAEVFRSSDGGETWVPAGLSRKRIDLLRAASGFVYAANCRLGCRPPKHVFSTPDGGATWREITPAFPERNVFATADIQIDPSRSSTLYLAYSYRVRSRDARSIAGGVLKSSDAGLTWTDASKGLICRTGKKRRSGEWDCL